MDTCFFDQALEMGASARYRTAPNPWVGCVIVRDGVICGKGATQPPGGAHAEAQALEQAAEKARGASAYCTLEPCSHYGRTPPCANALIEAGISRCVIGVLDPDPLVAGKGMAMLETAGVQTELLNSAAAKEQLAPYLHHRKTGRPLVRLKTALSIDGRAFAADRTSQWITCEEARRDVHALRDQAQAVLIGSGTELTDRPKLSVRHVPRQSPKEPLRVILDRRGRISPADNTLILRQDSLEEVLDELGKRGILEVLIEGGSQVHCAFLAQGLVDRLSIYVGPRIIGASGGPAFAGELCQTLGDASIWQMQGCTPLGNSVRIDYRRPG